MREKRDNTPLPGKEFDRIEQEAVRWFTRINNHDNDPADVESFYHWLEESQEHRVKYDAICAVMEEAREFTDDPQLIDFYQSIKVKTPVSSAAITQKKTSWKDRVAVWWGSGVRNRGAAMAVISVVLIVAFVQFQNSGTQGKVYQTGIGEIKIVRLDDNSVIKLNTRTTLTVDYDQDLRRIILSDGQATFSVAKNPLRPFVVSTGIGKITAIGTEFDILKEQGEIQINLIEGKIRVAKDVTEQTSTSENPAVIMEATNMKASYVAVSADGISEVEERDPIHAIAWQQRKIVFDGKTLSYVIKELNRYSARPIILGDISQKDELITAIFPTDVPAALVLIKRYFNLVEAVEIKDKIILVSEKDILI